MISGGRNAFREAIKSGKVLKTYILKNSEYLKDINKNRIRYEVVDKKQLDKMLMGNQGIVFETMDYQLYELKDIVNQKYEFIVILDELKDPHNLGAILRTSDAIGVDGVVYKKHNSVRLNDTVAKVSTGAIEYVKCVEVTNLSTTIEKLKKEGYWIVGLEANGSISYEKMDYKMKIALVIGSEGDGISRLVKEKLDFMVSLPMIGNVNSLNASNAFAIMAYKIYENRYLSTK